MDSEATLRIAIGVILGMMAIGIVLSIILIIFIVWRIRKIEIPPDADFFEALRYTPILIVITLDMLDFAFDFLSAPIGFTLLTFLGLNPLRGGRCDRSCHSGNPTHPTYDHRLGGCEVCG